LDWNQFRQLALPFYLRLKPPFALDERSEPCATVTAQAETAT
jgi:hypothetical protein